MDTEYFVYIVRSLKDHKFYTGHTDDNIEERLRAHNKGVKSTPSTLHRGPFELIHVEITQDRSEARKMEKYFKSGTGREIRDEIIENSKLW